MVLHVIPVPRAADTEYEPSSASRPMERDHGGRSSGSSQRRSRAGSSILAPSSPDDRSNQDGKRSVQAASQPGKSESNVSSGVKRDAHAAELLDEDEQGG